MPNASISVLKDRLESHVTQKVGVLGYVATEAAQLSSDLEELSAALTENVDKALAQRGKGIKTWLALKDVCYDLDDLLDYYVYVSKSKRSSHLSLFSGFATQLLRIRIGSKIRNFSKKIKDIWEGRDKDIWDEGKSPSLDGERGQSRHERQSPTRTFSEDIIGRERAVADILCILLNNEHNVGKTALVVPIVGVGGIGKTTVAKFIYDDLRVIRHFDARAWVNVSEYFDLNRITRGVIGCLTGEVVTNMEDGLETLLLRLDGILKGRLFLLVLDDVSNVDRGKWELLTTPLVDVCAKLTIMVTTRKEEVEVTVGSAGKAYHLQGLAPQDCWQLFADRAFSRMGSDARRFEGIGRKIVARCKGFPLAAKVMGNLMQTKAEIEEWQTVLNLMQTEAEIEEECQTVLESDLQKPSEAADDVSLIFRLSYNNLPSLCKQCLLYCAAFPPDRSIEIDMLIKLWMAHGYLRPEAGEGMSSSGCDEMEKRGLRYLNDLLTRSFLHDFREGEQTCKIHRIMHEFIRSLSRNEFFIKVNGDCLTAPDTIKSSCGEKVNGDCLTAPDTIKSSCGEKVNGDCLTAPDTIKSSCGEKVNGDCLTAPDTIKSSCGEKVNDNRFTAPDTIKSSCEEKVRHSTLVVSDHSPLPGLVLHELESIRSLLVLSDYTLVSVKRLTCLFNRLTRLRALSLSCSSVDKIPSQVRKMILLRYLNLSYNRNLKELPEAVCDLYHLQTLNLNGCDNLEKLPQGIGKLANLRHLEILWTLKLSFLPKGIGKLSTLLTLNRFVVNHSSGIKACNLMDLENLDKLQGYLYMDGLGNVENVEEARGVGLKSKTGLLGLDLWFSGVENQEVSSFAVLEALEPPQDLEFLGIYYYGGTIFPNWMATLKKLTELVLYNCRNCDISPCLAIVGTLPCLETLEIRDMDNVTKLSFDVSSSAGTPIFPKLARLCIHNMRWWEDWDKDALIFPRLSDLTIGGCPKLKTLPPLLKVEQLSISHCAILDSCFKHRNGEDWCHIANIKIDGKVVKEDGCYVSDSASIVSNVVKEDSGHVSNSASSPSKVGRTLTRKQSRLV